ncbi:PD-(D/E)XK nuclease family protein [bacterium]|nr:PD-(D/E)XK nuclease family protein [bacterium]
MSRPPHEWLRHVLADPFVEQLKRLCREESVRSKWVLLPNQSLRWTLGERLLHEGCDWVNLRLVTPLQLATEVAAPRLLDEGINPCPETLGPSLLQNLLLGLQPSTSYFRPLILQPGMAEALWRTLNEFRMAGLRSRDLARLPKGAKRAELAALFSAYEAYLAEEHLADRAQILAKNCPPPEPPVAAEPLHSVEQPDGQFLAHPVEASGLRPLAYDPAISEQDLVLVYPYHSWSPLELAWLSRLPGQLLLPETALQVPAGLAGWWERQVKGSEPGSRQFFCAVRRCDEIDEIVRRLAEESIPLDQVEIAAPLEDLGLVRDRLAAHGLGCSFEAGLPILTTRPGQLLDGVITWLDRGATAFHLRELLACDLLRARPDSHTAVKLLESAQVRWGRETYHPQLDSLAALSQQRLEREPNQSSTLAQLIQDIAELKSWLRQLFRRLPPADEKGHIRPEVWLQGLQETLRLDFQPNSAAEGQARQTLLQTLEELKMLPRQGWQPTLLLALLRQRLQGQRALASRPRPGQIHVCAPESSGLSGRHHSFWVGLEEGRMLQQAAQDCVLSDSERQQLHPGLTLSGQLSAQRLFQWRERLATSTGTLTLSYAQRDMTGDQEQMPSWLFLELVREQQPEIDNYQKLEHWLGKACGKDSRTCTELFPSLLRGVEAEKQRQSPQFTSFDGFVPSAAGLWDPRRTGQPISVSRLKTLATCPFQVFLENALGLQKPPAPLPEADTWLDSATRGTLLHEIYAAYHRYLRSRNWTPQAERDRAHLFQLLEKQLELVRKSLPAPSVALEKAERGSLKKELEHFLRLESQSGRRPIGLEVPFGMGPDTHEVLAQVHPVQLELGTSTLPLRGRIDRIDQLDDGYAVVDYKTGRELYTGKRNATYDRGRLLQHAIYSLVVEKMLQAPGRVMQSSYYFPTTAAARPWVHYGYPDRADLQRVLELVLEPLLTGVFVHTHEPDKDCRFCDYQAACEAHSHQLKPDGLLDGRRRLLEEL